MEDVVNMIRPLATTKSIELRIEDCQPDVTALADPPKTEQIIINLISNAVAFTESGGSITIGCGFGEDGVWIRVRDSGVGIAPDKLDSIFEPFVQVGRSLTTSHRGTGLGLAISRDLAKGMGGDLTVTSKVGEGSTFTLWLPSP
jgi:signal transduction histidine kinase